MAGAAQLLQPLQLAQSGLCLTRCPEIGLPAWPATSLHPPQCQRTPAVQVLTTLQGQDFLQPRKHRTAHNVQGQAYLSFRRQGTAQHARRGPQTSDWTLCGSWSSASSAIDKHPVGALTTAVPPPSSVLRYSMLQSAECTIPALRIHQATWQVHEGGAAPLSGRLRPPGTPRSASRWTRWPMR